MSARLILAGLLPAVLGLAQFAVLAGAMLALLAGHSPAQLAAMVPPAEIAVAVASAVLPGTMAALALWRLRSGGVMTGFLVAPLLIAPGFADQLPRLLLAASQGLAIGTVCGLLGLRGAQIGLIRAARCCGVSPSGAVTRVLLPLVAPAVLAGAILSALLAVGHVLFAHASLALPTTPPPQPLLLQAASAAFAVVALTAICLALLRRR